MTALNALVEATGQWNAENEEGELIGTGSCWPIGEDLVVTNLHVASMGSRAMVEFSKIGQMPIIGLVAVDKPRDIVIAKVRTKKIKLPALVIKDVLPKQGTDVYVIGSPYGLNQTVTRGIVSAIRELKELQKFGINGRKSDLYIQIDAAINSGSSGGPIADARGGVIAVSTFIIAQGQSLNFGVPARYVDELLDFIGEPQPLSKYTQTSINQTASPPSNHSSGQMIAAGRDVNDVHIMEHLFRLFLLVAHIDGNITEEEQNIIWEMFSSWGGTLQDFQVSVKNYLADIKTRDYTELAEESAFYLNEIYEKDKKQMIIDDLFQIAKSGGLRSEEARVIAITQEIFEM